MINRLPDFLRLIERKGIKLEPPKSVPIFIESDEMKGFAQQVNTGNRIIQSIKDNTTALIEIKRKLHNSFGGKEDSLKGEYTRISEVLETYRREGKDVAEKMRDISKLHKEKMQEVAIDKNISGYGDDEVRIISNLNGSFIKTFEISCAQAMTEQDEIKKILQVKLIRSAENIMGRDLNDNEKQEFLENEGKYQELLENKLTQGRAHINLQNKVRDLEARNEDIKKLENVSGITFICYL